MDKKSKLFLIFSGLFLSFMVFFFGYRFLHFYRLENPNPKREITLLKRLQKVKTVTSGTGLYQRDHDFYYYGKVKDNYLWYQGILYRIVSFNEDGIKIVTNAPVTSLARGTAAWEESYLKIWLNDGEQGKYLKNMDTSKISGEASLLSEATYQQSGGKDSYLALNQYWWLLENKIVLPGGTVEENDDEIFSYGVRPLITLMPHVLFAKGSGTASDPYQVEQPTSSLLSEQPIGSYLHYQNRLWRIIDKTETGIKVALDGFLTENNSDITKPFSARSIYFDPEEKDSLAYYLNHTYYDSLEHPEYLIDGIWQIGAYNMSNHYDYRQIDAKTVTAPIGLLSVADFFTTDHRSYFLINGLYQNEETIYTVVSDGRYYADYILNNKKIRPALYLKGNLTVKGTGEKNSPFEIGGIA